MQEPELITSLPLNYTSNRPLSSNLQWSEDGQIFIVTRAYHEKTPAHGFEFDTSSIKIALPFENNILKTQHLGWYKSWLDFDKTIVHQWSLGTDDWGTVSLGSLDSSWDSIAISPSRVTEDACCVFAALNTNLEVALCAPVGNYITGEWHKVQDVTDIIKSLVSDVTNPAQSVLNAQVHCISWSQQIGTGEDFFSPDGSLLALGNGAGRIIFMQLWSHIFEMKPVFSIEVADEWITHLAWSPWTKQMRNEWIGSLVCGAADGSVSLISVSAFLKKHNGPLEWSYEFHSEKDATVPADQTCLTGLFWVESTNHAPILVYSKPGLVFLRKMPSNLPLGWDGVNVIELQTQPFSSNSSAFAGASGFIHYPHYDSLLVSLFDGSFHIIHQLSDSPCLQLVSASLNSEDLSGQARVVFSAVEGKVSFSDANRTVGILDYDNAGTIAWVYERRRPDDFSYQVESQQTSMFVIAELWKDEDSIFKDVQAQLTHPTDLHVNPIFILKSFFLQLRKKSFIDAHVQRLLEFLKPGSLTNPEIDDFCRGASEMILSGMLAYRSAVTNAWFGRHKTRALQLKLNIARFCSNVSSIPIFAKVRKEIENNLECWRLLNIICNLSLVDQLEDLDHSFLKRCVTQCMIQEIPYLTHAAENIANRIGASIDSAAGDFEGQENCPACHAVISLNLEERVTCSNGHTWTRCSVTSFILPTGYVRTCVGCLKRTILPPSARSTPASSDMSRFPPAASSRIVAELLEAATRCIFCGNRFVRAL